MRLFSNLDNLLLAAEDSGSGGNQGSGVEDLIEFLGEDDVSDTKDKASETSEDLLTTTGDKDEKTKTDDELKEEDVTDKEEDEPEAEDLELTTPASRKAILKKYPELFKDFPYLEKAYYREQAFTEIFPTLEDAKEAAGKIGDFAQFEQSLLQGGSTEAVLKSVKEADGEAFKNIVDNYLPALQKVEPQAYFHVVGNLIRQTVAGMYKEGKRIENERLQEAAVILNQYVFGTSNYQEPTAFGKGNAPNQEADKIKSERAALINDKFEAAREDLTTRANNVVKSTIANHIDPTGQMSDYVKKNAVKDAQDNLDSLLMGDSRFRTFIDKLWERAFDQNFSKKSLDDIKSAYLSKSKTLLPAVIKKARVEALKGLGKKETADREEPVRKGPLPSGRAATQSSSSQKNATIPRGMSTLEFFNQD